MDQTIIQNVWKLREEAADAASSSSSSVPHWTQTAVVQPNFIFFGMKNLSNLNPTLHDAAFRALSDARMWAILTHEKKSNLENFRTTVTPLIVHAVVGDDEFTGAEPKLLDVLERVLSFVASQLRYKLGGEFLCSCAHGQQRSRLVAAICWLVFGGGRRQRNPTAQQALTAVERATASASSVANTTANLAALPALRGLGAVSNHRSKTHSRHRLAPFTHCLFCFPSLQTLTLPA